MYIKSARFFGFAILLMLVVFPTMPAAASNARLAQGNVISDGQFVYGPNVGSFDVKAYLNTHAAHLAPYADDLYGRAEYYSINPKIYLTLLEMHSRLISTQNRSAIANPFGLNNGGFIAQIDTLSNKMTAAYYDHLYNDSALPVASRTLRPFTTADGGSLDVAPETNAGSYAIIAGLAAIDPQNVALMLDNNRVDGFYQTYRRLFENDDPLDGKNHINIPGTADALAAPATLLQVPYIRGLSWKFGGVHDTSGCSGTGWNGCGFTDGSAIDMYPIGSTWGIDTSSMWVVAAAAGTPTRVSNCYYKVLHADGWETAYYHLENTQTYSGQVKQNDIIGVIANTEAEATCNGGAASGPHVHFWLRHNGANVAINGTSLSGWTVHAGRGSYDTDPNYMWLERAGVRKYAFSDTILSEATLTSIVSRITSTQDGWVLESAENSNVGGASNGTGVTFRLGDDATKKQSLGILTFNTSSLPDNAVISVVTLRIKLQSVVGGGDPVTAFQGFTYAMRTGTFGPAAVQATDFQANANSVIYGPFTPGLIGGWYYINLTQGQSYINKLATNSGLTQIRLRLKLDDNNDAIANYASFFSSNAVTATDLPQLVVTYSVP